MLLLLSILAAIAVNIIISDVKERKISNAWVLLNFTVCLVLSLLLGAFPIWQGLLVSLVTFVIGLGLFRFKIFGAGDIKLLMGYSLCFNFPLALTNLIEFLLVGGVVVVIQLGWAYITAGYAELKARGVPYGIAIASVSVFNIGCLVFGKAGL
ncbi:prepilin peptidase [Photobacterium sanguinicancri]|uniref:prepilin peptidase n=1 Tax=Photobacterium sanguinicancri TaxID=875932 RepID=UPI0021C45B24|nr:prepilin peptidase [Photobacterium sanguinicancri]